MVQPFVQPAIERASKQQFHQRNRHAFSTSQSATRLRPCQGEAASDSTLNIHGTASIPHVCMAGSTLSSSSSSSATSPPPPYFRTSASNPSKLDPPITHPTTDHAYPFPFLCRNHHHHQIIERASKRDHQDRAAGRTTTKPPSGLGRRTLVCFLFV